MSGKFCKWLVQNSNRKTQNRKQEKRTRAEWTAQTICVPTPAVAKYKTERPLYKSLVPTCLPTKLDTLRNVRPMHTTIQPSSVLRALSYSSVEDDQMYVRKKKNSLETLLHVMNGDGEIPTISGVRLGSFLKNLLKRQSRNKKKLPSLELKFHFTGTYTVGLHLNHASQITITQENKKQKSEGYIQLDYLL